MDESETSILSGTGHRGARENIAGIPGGAAGREDRRAAAGQTDIEGQNKLGLRGGKSHFRLTHQKDSL